MMKILLSNDDGVHAEGLTTLAAALAPFGEITVVAPDRNRSAASNSLTLEVPLRVTQQSNGFYAVTGTPTDSVHIAITGWLDEHPDMIISGINAGANLGDDVLYSGTVAAAMEGRFLGYPAMAISLVSEQGNRYEKYNHYETAATIAGVILKKLLRDPLPANTILNINVPDKPFAAIKGIKITRLGHRHMAEPTIQQLDPRGKTIYWVGPAGEQQDAGPGTDFHAINNGYVSITPLKIDLTDYAAMDNLTLWSQDILLQID